ncbi:MAG: hypothetical protein OEV21_07425, partial [Thermoplasmata archaeon]|nr:hypothetical protein [Thermoplasmata archaeon]
SALLEKMNSPKISLNQLLNEAVRMIHRVLEFQCVTIALKDYVDGLYRYNAFIGLTPSMENEYRKIEYSAKDLLDSNIFPYIKINRFSYFFMTEDNPYKTGEEMTTFRPGQFSEMRKHPEDMLDPDYFDVFMFGNAGDIIGWIEAFNTRSGKLPKRETIRCLELIASALSAVIMAKGFERK